MRNTLVGTSLALLLLGGCAKGPEHACSGRRDYWHRPHNFEGLVPQINMLSITATGTIYWNGQAISWATLRRYLALSHRLNPEPTTFLEAEMGVPCDVVERVRDEMDKELDCRHGGRCDEGIFSVCHAETGSQHDCHQAKGCAQPPCSGKRVNIQRRTIGWQVEELASSERTIEPAATWSTAGSSTSDKEGERPQVGRKRPLPAIWWRMAAIRGLAAIAIPLRASVGLIFQL